MLSFLASILIPAHSLRILIIVDFHARVAPVKNVQGTSTCGNLFHNTSIQKLLEDKPVNHQHEANIASLSEKISLSLLQY